MALIIEIERRDGLPVVHLRGELDIYTVPKFTTRADEALSDDQAIIVVLEEVDLVDSSGLGALIRLSRPSGERRHVALVSQKAWIGRLLDLAHVTEHFVLAADVAAAARALRAAGNEPG